MKKSPALIFLFVSCAISYAAGSDNNVINFNPSNGLPDISISSICQDSYNRTWVGTKRGVYYYTGYGFIALQNRDYLSKCSQNTSLVAMDGDDRLWIFTDGGSGFYNIVSDDFIPIPQLNGISVTDVDFDGSGTAWITSPDGIFRFSTDDSSLSAVIEGSFMNPYKSCLLSNSRLVFTSHDDNLFFYDIEKKSLRSFSIKNATSLGLIEVSGESDLILSDGETTVCLVHLIDATGHDGQVYEAYPILESSASISCLLCTGSSIWVGTSYGIEILNNNSGGYEKQSGGNTELTTFRGESIFCLFQDSEENIWVGTYNTGLCCYINEEGFNRYVSDGQRNSLRGTSIRAVCGGLTGEVWTGSQEGYLCRFDAIERTFTDFTVNAAIPYGSAITDIDYFDDFLWISTFGSGVFVFDPVKQQCVKHYDLPVNKCLSINNTTTGDIYVGTFNGLFALNTDTGNFEIVDILGDVFVHDVYEDSSGRCWISSYGKGLAFIDLETSEYHTITKDNYGNELDAKNIINLSEDSSGAIWIGTDTGILSKIVMDTDNTNYRITNYDLNSDMAPVSISGIVDEGDGYLWVATTHGLVLFNSLQGKMEKIYLQNDNIVGSHMCYGGEYIDDDGNIYFGTSMGLVTFDPLFIRSEYSNSKLYITDIITTSDDKRMSSISHLGFSPLAAKKIRIRQKDARQILISFSAMKYGNPNIDIVECQLSKPGFRSVATTERQYLTYYGLRPGKYQFSVQYLDNADDDLGSSMSFRILAPWYSSFFAKVLYCLLIGFIVLEYLSSANKKKVVEAERMRQLQLAQKEKDLAQEKMMFMTQVTHEIRTPVTVILILLEKMAASAGVPEHLKDSIDSIKINAERLKKYCNDILDLRKMDNGISQLTLSEENIVELIRKSESAFASAASARGLSIHMLLPEIDTKVSCDREAVETVICYLLSNAVKYARGLIVLSCVFEPEVVRIKVDNDGDRIPDADSERIFDAFYQIRRPDNYGIGIGLTFSRRLARMHHGELFLDTSNKEMTSFVFELPLNTVQDSSPSIANNSIECATVDEDIQMMKEDISDDNVKILVVEDNDILRNVLKDELGGQYDVCCAPDGVAALEILREERIDLVISDIMMPKMDGCELCNTIKEDIQLSHIPVLLMTAAVGVETNLRSLRSGADAYIEKPFKMDILVANINNLFRNRDIRNNQFASSPLAHISCSNINKVEYEFVNALHDYILDHISEPELSIDRLADEMSMSKASLSRKVKMDTGLTVNEYVRVCRLKKAVELLSENKYKINEVAFLVGYASASYFTKIFQKQFGKLPSDFIRQV